MLIALALLLATDDAAAAMIKADLRGCGVDPARLSTEYRPELEDAETTVAGATSISDDQMRCLALIAATHGYIIAFDDPKLRDRFWALYGDASSEAGRKLARDELAKAGLLDSLPVYDPKGESLDAFAARVERFCGVKPGGVLKRAGANLLTINPPALRRGLSDAQGSRQIWCVEMAMMANDLKAAGAKFAFIGNAPR